MFLNISNHNSAAWGESQLAAAGRYGEIVDFAFPNIDVELTTEQISQMAQEWMERIEKVYNPQSDVVHIMGEMTFTYALVKLLRSAGFVCLASTTQRIKQALPDGTFISEFRFFKFRCYE